MERLSVGPDDAYDPVEASIHVGRYALALPFARGRRVLDVACGEGYGSWLLADAGAVEVVGLDISEEAIAKARAIFAADRLRFELGAAEELAASLANGHFDLVVSIETLEHVEDPERFLQAIRRVAREDAVFVVTCPNDHWYYADGQGNPHHRRKLRLAEFQALTTATLGPRVQWLLGSASLGFGAVPLDGGRHARTGLPSLVDVAAPGLSLRVPSGDAGPSAENCSFFVGVWNAPERLQGAGAHHVVSMDAYARMMWVWRQRAESLQAALDEIHGAAGPDTAELGIRTVQAAALRRENDVMAASIAELRRAMAEAERHGAERLAAAERHGAERLAMAERQGAERLAAADAALAQQAARLQDVESALAWHVERVRSLDEALAWHVARIGNLESEPASRLLRRALGQGVRGASSVTRLAQRLRRRADGN